MTTMDTARIVFRHDPGASPQWSYYGVNAPVTGSAERLSEAKFAATQDIQFLSGDSHPHMTAFVEWRALESVRGLPAIYVRAVQDEDTYAWARFCLFSRTFVSSSWTART